jgi:hypothetical protein
VSCWQLTNDLPICNAASGCASEILSVKVLYGCGLSCSKDEVASARSASLMKASRQIAN